MNNDVSDKLYKRYLNPASKFFLVKNINDIYNQAKKDADLNPVTYKDILTFKNSLETISREKEKRILKWRKRHLSYRKWVTWGPNNVHLADLAFLRPIKDLNNKKYIILVIQDAFSRLVFLRLLRNSSSAEVKKRLGEAFEFFKGTPKKFGCDRGNREKMK